MKSTAQILEQQKRFLVPTYAPSLALVSGRGSFVRDAEGHRFLDFTSGIAVCNLGHCHPAIVESICRQAGTLMHVSNLYANEPQPQAAEHLSRIGLGGKVFFANCGATANESLIKLARKWGADKGKHEVVTFWKSFHGRSLATLTATGQEKVQRGFHPLPSGFAYADLHDMHSVKRAVTKKTAALLIEPVQGEGGVLPVDPAFLRELRDFCHERDILLMFDEVQTGLGRTGQWFGYEHSGVVPDAISLAKGLGGGFPIGAILTGPKTNDVLQPGSHATTFGGNPIGTAVISTIIETIERDNILGNANERSDQLFAGLNELREKHPFIGEVRGLGLMIGMVLDRPAKPLQDICTENHLLCIATAGNVIRLLPPLTVTAEEVKQALGILERACDEWSKTLA